MIEWRKKVIEFMLISAPNAKAILDLAKEYGVEDPKIKIEGMNCIFCGLCARMCQERIGARAIPVSAEVFRSEEKCLRCGACAFICPTKAIKPEEFDPKAISIPFEFEVGMKSRPPIYIPFPQAVPNLPVLDRERCVHFLTGKCEICKDLCEAKAIDFEQTDEVVEVKVGSIILATGYDQFDPSVIPEYGYGRYENVITGLEFERLSNAAGPTAGQILLKNGRPPRSVAIIHCVGSRDKNFHPYCSRVCCMYALKFAHLIREKTDAEVYQMYIDMRCFGEGYEEFYERVGTEDGVNFIRGKASQVTDQALNEEEEGKLIVCVEDTLLGSFMRVPVEMVILCTALEPRANAEEVARLFSIGRRADGFFLERHVKLAPIATMTEGLFIAGCCECPKDIPDTVAQAKAAACDVLSLLARGKVEIEPIVASVDEEVCSGCGLCGMVCQYGAPSLAELKRVTVVNQALCKGCGACAVTCPSGAMNLSHFTRRQMLEEVEALTWSR
ncbi:MAG: Electron transport complex subunit RsxB [Chloroflexi bacterium]|nr:Electron transport complex subunit RsxB [Chloroflexota bacterium]